MEAHQPYPEPLVDIHPHSVPFERLREDALVSAVFAATEGPEVHLPGRAPSRSAGP